MTIRIRKHGPALEGNQTFIERDVPDQAAMLAVKWIARHKGLSPAGKPFHRFSVSRFTHNHEAYGTLMAEWDEGREYAVAAHILQGVESVTLPEWVQP